MSGSGDMSSLSAGPPPVGRAGPAAPRLVQPEQAEWAPIEDRWLWDLVQALPRRQREVVVLRYWCDLAEADIAQVLSISTGTVKSSAHRAHARLAAALAEHNGEVTKAQKGAR